MPVQAALGAVVRARRIELGWTQEYLAERISADGEYVRQSEISRIENGRIALPRRERLERIAEVLGLSLGELLASSGWTGAELHFHPLSDGGAPADSTVDTDQIAAFRQYLSGMRDEPERSPGERLVITHIEQQLHQLLSDAGDGAAQPAYGAADR
jgi:transcriptional regulator with XRE-family HTH domain